MKIRIRRLPNQKLAPHPLVIELSGNETCLTYENGKTLHRILGSILGEIKKQMESLDEIQGILK